MAPFAQNVSETLSAAFLRVPASLRSLGYIAGLQAITPRQSGNVVTIGVFISAVSCHGITEGPGGRLGVGAW
jgi:hypothetical protein